MTAEVGLVWLGYLWVRVQLSDVHPALHVWLMLQYFWRNVFQHDALPGRYILQPKRLSYKSGGIFVPFSQDKSLLSPWGTLDLDQCYHNPDPLFIGTVVPLFCCRSCICDNHNEYDARPSISVGFERYSHLTVPCCDAITITTWCQVSQVVLPCQVENGSVKNQCHNNSLSQRFLRLLHMRTEACETV